MDKDRDCKKGRKSDRGENNYVNVLKKRLKKMRVKEREKTGRNIEELELWWHFTDEWYVQTKPSESILISL